MRALLFKVSIDRYNISFKENVARQVFFEKIYRYVHIADRRTCVKKTLLYVAMTFSNTSNRYSCIKEIEPKMVVDNVAFNRYYHD